MIGGITGPYHYRSVLTSRQYYRLLTYSRAVAVARWGIIYPPPQDFGILILYPKARPPAWKKKIWTFFLKEFLKEMLGGGIAPPPGSEDFPPPETPPQR